MDILQNLIVEKIREKFSNMAEEKKIKEEPKEEMVQIEPDRQFLGFSFAGKKEKEEKPDFLLKPPRNEGGETYLDILKREKQEDKEFYKMIVLQEKRRLAKNPNLVTGTFGPGTGTKSLYDKIQDLLKDYYYPENEFNRLKLDVILAEKLKEEAEAEVQQKRDVEKELQITKEELQKAIKENQKATKKIQDLKEEVAEQETEIEEQEKENDEQDKEIDKLEEEVEKLQEKIHKLEKAPPLFFSEEEYKKLQTFNWILENEIERTDMKNTALEEKLTEKENELQELKDNLQENREIMKRMECEMETWLDIDYVQKSKELEKKLAEKEKELQELKYNLQENREIMKRMEIEIESPYIDYVKKSMEMEKKLAEKEKELQQKDDMITRMEANLFTYMDSNAKKFQDKEKDLDKKMTEKEKELQEYKQHVKEMENINQKMKDEVLKVTPLYDTSEAATFIREIQQKVDQQIQKAKEKLALMEAEVDALKTDNKENVKIFAEILDQILPHIKDMTETFNEAEEWVKAAATGEQREAWSIYVEPKIATEEKFKSLKELFTEHCHKFCFVRNGKTHNISGEIQLKKPLNIKELNKLLGPNIYLNGRPKEQATEKWSMAAKFNENDYFSIFFTDQTLKGGDTTCEISK
ncbi:golgin subfamily A member 6-like protein 25 [Crassostrea angulata]|uniref:golgin subfamily A member 6-like protein 25 n=1 Tax=Magallana angulata TaxID=2784310 RepID=UPI0022B0F293|nr:golgin subfamily A member 6-like protein 25 [Crassostrea angulata]